MAVTKSLPDVRLMVHKFEHKLIRSTGKLLDADINQVEAEGWHLVGFFENPPLDFGYHFRRIKQRE